MNEKQKDETTAVAACPPLSAELDAKIQKLNPEQASQLLALKTVLDLTGEDDWYLIHNAVRNQVDRGKLSKELEGIYADMVDEIGNARCA